MMEESSRVVIALSLHPVYFHYPTIQISAKLLAHVIAPPLGITEQTDAVVIMVSEETGEISVACDGKIYSYRQS